MHMPMLTTAITRFNHCHCLWKVLWPTMLFLKCFINKVGLDWIGLWQGVVRGAAAGVADTPELDQLITPPLLNVLGPEEFLLLCMCGWHLKSYSRGVLNKEKCLKEWNMWSGSSLLPQPPYAGAVC